MLGFDVMFEYGTKSLWQYCTVLRFEIVGSMQDSNFSLVRYVILAISVAKINFIVFMVSLWVK